MRLKSMHQKHTRRVPDKLGFLQITKSSGPQITVYGSGFTARVTRTWIRKQNTCLQRPLHSPFLPRPCPKHIHSLTSDNRLFMLACMLSHFSCVYLFCYPMDCGPPGSSVHGVLQARILEWVVISFSRGSSQPRDQTLSSYVSCTDRCALYH